MIDNPAQVKNAKNTDGKLHSMVLEMCCKELLGHWYVPRKMRTLPEVGHKKI